MQGWWMETTILSIPVWNWIVALSVTTLVLFVLFWIRGTVRKRLREQPDKHHLWFITLLLRALSSTSAFALFVLSVLIGVKFLELPLAWSSGLSQLWFVAVVTQVTLWASHAITYTMARYIEHRPDLNRVTMTIVGMAARAVVWVVAVLAILDNMGVNITAFVASLGIGGVAVALAAQVVLGDLFASISIGLDKPFEPGDFIVVGGVAGNIEHVGLKTTRIRSLGGEQIVCSNTELLKQTIQNYKRMDLRRIAFSFTVAYGATAAQAEAISRTVKEIITAIEGARYDRAHLLKFSERGLEFEVVYYVLSADYNRYMDIQQTINLEIMRKLEHHGLQFGRGEMRVLYENPGAPEASISDSPALRSPDAV
jgi:small-conductance mechanosensitive channel